MFTQISQSLESTLRNAGHAQNYLAVEQDRASPFLQETFDACAAVLHPIEDLNNDELAKRPNMLDCVKILVQMMGAIHPQKGRQGEHHMNLDEIVEWRNRMQEALSLLGIARYLWIADSLALQGFDGTGDSTPDS